MPRPRLTLRWLMFAVAIAAVVLGGERILYNSAERMIVTPADGVRWSSVIPLWIFFNLPFAIVTFGIWFIRGAVADWKRWRSSR